MNSIGKKARKQMGKGVSRYVVARNSSKHKRAEKRFHDAPKSEGRSAYEAKKRAKVTA